MTKETMASYLWDLPEQFAAALRQGVQLPSGYRRKYHNIMVSGLGGSAIGGDVLRNYALDRSPVPVIVNRDYAIPAFINEHSLVVAVSYSGNTEETLSAYRQAGEQKAARIAVTSGGQLADLACADGSAVVSIPAGLSPRAATGYLLTPLALILQELDIVAGVDKDINEVIDVLRAMRQRAGPHQALGENQARQIARDIKGQVPLIWGSSGHSEIAALRWKTQINENAKCPAFYNFFPELNHNEIVGFEAPADILSRLVVVMLRDPMDHVKVKKRMDISQGIIQDRVAKVIQVHSRGQGFLARFYSLAYLGDYVSYYLAEEYGINPTPVKIIDFLKNELKH